MSETDKKFHELIYDYEPDLVGQLLGTGFMRFISPTGIDGLAKWQNERLDILAVHAAQKGKGQFRNFISKAKEIFDTVCVWEIENPIVEASLQRYGFTPETEIQGNGQPPVKGMRWDKPK